MSKKQPPDLSIYIPLETENDETVTTGYYQRNYQNCKQCGKSIEYTEEELLLGIQHVYCSKPCSDAYIIKHLPEQAVKLKLVESPINWNHRIQESKRNYALLQAAREG